MSDRRKLNETADALRHASIKLTRRPWWRRSLATLTWMPLSVRQRPRWARMLWIVTTPLWHSPLRRIGPTRRALQRSSDWLAAREVEP